MVACLICCYVRFVSCVFALRPSRQLRRLRCVRYFCCLACVAYVALSENPALRRRIGLQIAFYSLLETFESSPTPSPTPKMRQHKMTIRLKDILHIEIKARNVLNIVTSFLWKMLIYKKCERTK